MDLCSNVKRIELNLNAEAGKLLSIRAEITALKTYAMRIHWQSTFTHTGSAK